MAERFDTLRLMMLGILFPHQITALLELEAEEMKREALAMTPEEYRQYWMAGGY